MLFGGSSRRRWGFLHSHNKETLYHLASNYLNPLFPILQPMITSWYYLISRARFLNFEKLSQIPDPRSHTTDPRPQTLSVQLNWFRPCEDLSRSYHSGQDGWLIRNQKVIRIPLGQNCIKSPRSAFQLKRRCGQKVATSYNSFRAARAEKVSWKPRGIISPCIDCLWNVITPIGFKAEHGGGASRICTSESGRTWGVIQFAGKSCAQKKEETFLNRRRPANILCRHR